VIVGISFGEIEADGGGICQTCVLYMIGTKIFCR
jgi:hypothetical protein